MARCWYAYLGSGDPTLPSNYTLAGVTPACLNGCTVCAIYAPSCGVTPSAPLSANMRRYIAALLITCIAQPQDSDRFKKYVYGKNT